MARTPAVFGNAEIPASVAVLVGPVPSGQRWYVTRLDVSNNSAANVNLTIYLNTQGVVRQWGRALLDANGGHCEAIDDKAIVLEEGDMILAQASALSALTYYAAGVKEIPG